MCWTTTRPGHSGGSISSTMRRDSVPPVETPMQTTGSVALTFAQRTAGGRMASAVSFGWTRCDGASAGARRRRLTAAFSRSRMASALASSSARVASPGSRTTSVAPAAIASATIGEDSAA